LVFEDVIKDFVNFLTYSF